MALLSLDKIVIPMRGDFIPIEGIQGIIILIFENYFSSSLQKYAVHVIIVNTQLKAFQLKVPTMYESAFNNYQINLGGAKAFDAIRTELIHFCYEQFKSFPSYFATTESAINSINEWQNL